jgi:hypothetical protein
VTFVIGTALNAGFISGSPRYDYGKTLWNIPHQYIKKRERLRVVAAQFGADLRTAALQFSAAPDVAAALIVGAHTEVQAPRQCELHAGNNPSRVLGRAGNDRSSSSRTLPRPRLLDAGASCSASMDARKPLFLLVRVALHQRNRGRALTARQG